MSDKKSFLDYIFKHSLGQTIYQLNFGTKPEKTLLILRNVISTKYFVQQLLLKSRLFRSNFASAMVPPIYI